MPYDTKEEILKLGEPDPEFMAFIKANPPPPVDYTSLKSFAEMAERRNVLLKKMLGDTPPTIKRSETTYPARDGTQNRALLFQPATPPAEGSPLIVLFHGGGYCIGSPEGEEQTCRNLVHAFGATCISAMYRLAPQHKFPQGINDAWDALQWAAANAKDFGADTNAGFIVGGTSAGGNFSAVLTLKARDHNLSPPLTGQYLAIPAVCPIERLPEKYKKYSFSYEQNAKAPVLPMDAIDMFMAGYEPDYDDTENFVPLNNPKGHKGLPRTYFQIDGMDPLRDEALIYERILREECGVETKFDVYPGLPHGHWGFFPALSSSDKFRKEQVEGFGFLLNKTPDMSKVIKDAKPAGV